MSNKPLQIMFKANGDLYEQAYNYSGNPVKTEEAKDFDDRMEFIQFREYIRKSARVVIKSTATGRTYSMFLDDFNDVVQAKRFVDNFLEGTFRFVKRGAGQAIKLLLPPKVQP